MSKRVKFLNCILNESIRTIVYETQKLDSQKGDFVDRVNEDFKELNICLNEEVIKSIDKDE